MADTQPITAPPRRLFRDILSLYGQGPWLLPAVVALGLTSSIFEGIGIYLFIPLLQVITAGGHTDPGRMFGIEIDALRQIPQHMLVPVIAGLIVLTLALKNLLTFANTILVDWTDSRFAHALRGRIHRILLDADYSFLERQELGRVQSLLLSDTWRVTEAFSTLLKAIVTICYLVVLTAVLLAISVKVTLVVAVLIGGFLVLTQLVTKSIEAYGARAVEVNAAFAARVWETFYGLVTVRDFGREAYEDQRFNEASAEVAETFYRLGRVSAVAGPLFETLAALLLASLLVFAGGWGLSFAALSAYILVLYRLQPRAREVAASRVSLLGLRGSVQAVKALLDLSEEAAVPAGREPFDGFNQAITLDKIGFCYPTRDTAALSDVSFTIPKGSMTALVGPSGAGKSSLVALLCRYYQPDAGVIRVDGRPLEDLKLDEWRGRLAVVRQENFLFGTTIGENIAYGAPDATPDEVVAAATLAHAHDFICEMPDGYDTLVGDRGRRLSGGQRQRIALARALLRRPEILILDEATNELDSLTEVAIQAAIEDLRRTCTLIIIAHRLSTIASADQVVVMEAGRVVQTGTFAKLAHGRGLFARMLKAQTFRAAEGVE